MVNAGQAPGAVVFLLQDTASRRNFNLFLTFHQSPTLDGKEGKGGTGKRVVRATSTSGLSRTARMTNPSRGSDRGPAKISFFALDGVIDSA
jgi:antirestriction protein ArdC